MTYGKNYEKIVEAAKKTELNIDYLTYRWTIMESEGMTQRQIEDYFWREIERSE